jgi:hypothetical protein
MADMQAGIGPFLGVFLLARRWKDAAIGLVMTMGGVAGLVITGPAGALVDSTRRKRSLVAVAGVCTVAASQAAAARSGAALDPVLSALFGMLSSASVALIRRAFIDDDAARGMQELLSILLWIGFASVLRPPCAGLAPQLTPISAE